MITVHTPISHINIRYTALASYTLVNLPSLFIHFKAQKLSHSCGKELCSWTVPQFICACMKVVCCEPGRPDGVETAFFTPTALKPSGWLCDGPDGFNSLCAEVLYRPHGLRKVLKKREKSWADGIEAETSSI